MQTDTIETFWKLAQTADCVLEKAKETSVETKRTFDFVSKSHIFTMLRYEFYVLLFYDLRYNFISRS